MKNITEISKPSKINNSGGGGLREPFIDAAKGLCILSVIFIHTVFWSGNSYTPLYIKNLSLLFDVPVFFFLTGCLMSIKPDIDPIKQIAKIILIFFIPVLVINSFSGYCSLKNLMQPICLSFADIKLFKVVGGSYWFVPVYVVGLIYSVLITKFLNKFWQVFIAVGIAVYYVYSWAFQSVLNINMLGVPAQRELFYLWLILLGFLTFKFKNKIIWVLFVLISAVSLGIMYSTIDGFFLQKYKFVTHLPYVLASLGSVGVLMLFKNILKNKFLEYLGSRALYFYLSQGIGASILLTVVKYIHLHWVLKLAICYSINLAISLGLGFLFCKTVEFYPRIKDFVFKLFSRVLRVN